MFYIIVFLVTIRGVVKQESLFLWGMYYLLLGLFILQCKTGGTFIYVWRTPGLWILFRRCFLLWFLLSGYNGRYSENREIPKPAPSTVINLKTQVQKKRVSFLMKPESLSQAHCSLRKKLSARDAGIQEHQQKFSFLANAAKEPGWTYCLKSNSSLHFLVVREKEGIIKSGFVF